MLDTGWCGNILLLLTCKLKSKCLLAGCGISSNDGSSGCGGGGCNGGCCCCCCWRGGIMGDCGINGGTCCKWVGACNKGGNNGVIIDGGGFNGSILFCWSFM